MEYSVSRWFQTLKIILSLRWSPIEQGLFGLLKKDESGDGKPRRIKVPIRKCLCTKRESQLFGWQGEDCPPGCLHLLAKIADFDLNSFTLNENAKNKASRKLSKGHTWADFIDISLLDWVCFRSPRNSHGLPLWWCLETTKTNYPGLPSLTVDADSPTL